MTDDFCLSDKIKYSTSNGYDRYWHFEAGDVKEFIKRLKDKHIEWRIKLEGSCDYHDSFEDDIDTLAGEKLTKFRCDNCNHLFEENDFINNLALCEDCLCEICRIFSVRFKKEAKGDKK